MVGIAQGVPVRIPLIFSRADLMLVHAEVV
jgi:hypothetical protein